MIILDTSFLVGYKIENDSHHENAKGIFARIVGGEYGEAVISDYIFDEIVTVIMGKSKRLEIAVKTGDELKNSLKVMEIGRRHLDNAWEIFKSQKATKLSFTDCTTLSIMAENKIRDIATFDADFKNVKEINVVN